MVLHEWYFGNMARDAGGEISSSSPLGRAIGESFGDIDTWRRDFTAIGGMRGVGWAVTYLDPRPGGCPTTGSRCTRTATSRASSRWW